MKKYVFFKVDASNQAMIDLSKVTSISIGSGNTEIDFRTSDILQDGTVGNALAVSYRITFAGMTAAQNAAAINLLFEHWQKAYTTSWTNAVEDMSTALGVTVTGITRAELAWA
jgi:hypothetical protein